MNCDYTQILREELVPATGCTEPIAIAYASATARRELGEVPEKMKVICSGNIIKNVKGVTVPNSGGQKGIETAAVLGAFGGNAEKVLEVLADTDDAAREKTRELVKAGFCEVELAEGVPNLYIRAELTGKTHRVGVTIENQHTCITGIEKDGQTLFQRESPPITDRKNRFCIHKSKKGHGLS